MTLSQILLYRRSENVACILCRILSQDIGILSGTLIESLNDHQNMVAMVLSAKSLLHASSKDPEGDEGDYKILPM